MNIPNGNNDNESDEFDLYEEPDNVVADDTNDDQVASDQSVDDQSVDDQVADDSEDTQPDDKPKEEPVTPASIAKAIRDTMGEVTSKPKEDEPELTQEDIDKYLKTAKYTSDDLKSLGLIDDEMEAEEADRRTKLFNDLQQRSVQQAVATSQMLMQHQASQLNEQINPLIASYQAQQQEAMVGSFYGKYEALKDYEEIVKIAASNAVQEKKLEGKSFDEVSQIIATDAAALVKKFSGIDLQLSATKKSQAKKTAVKTDKSVKPAGQTVGGRSQQRTDQDVEKTPSEFDIYDEE